MKIDTSTWKEFLLHEIVVASMGTGLDANKTTTDNPKYNYVGRSAENNGVMNVVDEVEGLDPFPANCLTLALGGSLGSCFLQTKPFYTAQNVAVLQSETPLSTEAWLFLASVIQFECKIKFQAFGRELNSHFRKDFTLKLPATADGKPDWQYMENYIKSIHYKNITTKIEKQPLELNTNHWIEFNYTDIFVIKKGFYNKKPEESGDGTIPFLGATANKNGVTSYYTFDEIKDASKTGDEPNANIEEKIFPPHAVCVTNNGSVGFAYYQHEEFTCSHDVNPLYRKDGQFNKYTGLFIATVIMHDRYRWDYGRKWRPERMVKSKIKLPATTDGKPDWQFMEDYIKSLPYSDRIL